MLKKIFGLFLVGLIIVFTAFIYLSFLQKPVELKILLPAYQAPVWEELIEDFESEHKNIKIKMVQASDAGDVVRNIYTSEKSKSEYDLVYMDIMWVYEFAKKDKLVNLSGRGYFSEKELKEMEKDFLPNEWKSGYYDRKLYQIPFYSDVGLLYYNKDLLNQLKYQPPHTYDELISISENLQKERPLLKGFVWQGMQYEGLVATFIEVLNYYEGFWINEEGEVGLDRDESIKAVKFLHNAIYENNISPQEVITFTERESNSLFKESEAVFLRSWPGFWNRGNELDSKIRGKFDFVQPRERKDEIQSIQSCLGGWGLGIDNNSKHKEQVFEAIKYFTSAAVQRKYVLKTGNMPSRRSLFNDLQLVKKYNYYPRLLKISEKAVSRPRLEKYSDISKILQEHLSNVLKQPKIPRKCIEHEMKIAANDIREKLNRPKVELDTTIDCQ